MVRRKVLIIRKLVCPKCIFKKNLQNYNVTVKILTKVLKIIKKSHTKPCKATDINTKKSSNQTLEC